MDKRRLLFVDDEPNIRITLPLILAQRGFEVTTAVSVPEALDLINKERFDLLISDLNIGQPGDGFNLVTQGLISDINDPNSPTNLTWSGQLLWNFSRNTTWATP